MGYDLVMSDTNFAREMDDVDGEQIFVSYISNLEGYTHLIRNAYIDVMLGLREGVRPAHIELSPAVSKVTKEIFSFEQSMRKTRHYSIKDLHSKFDDTDNMPESSLPSYVFGGKKYLFATSRKNDVQFGICVREEDLRAVKITPDGKIQYNRPELRIQPFFYLPPNGLKKKRSSNFKEYIFFDERRKLAEEDGDYNLPTALFLFTSLAAFTLADVPQFLAAHLLNATYSRAIKENTIDSIEGFDKLPSYSAELILELMRLEQAINKRALMRLGYVRREESTMLQKNGAVRHFLKSMSMSLFDQIRDWTHAMYTNDFLFDFSRAAAKLPVVKTIDL